MFDDTNFSLSPVNFFQLRADCHQLEKGFPQLAKAKGNHYVLPDSSPLTNEDIFATLFMGWSRLGIELHVVVLEKVTECHYPDVTRGDSVELFFDTRDVKTSGFNTKFCHHFYFLPEAIEGHIKGEITKFRTEDAHELCDSDELTLKVKKSQGGYSMEIFIPASCLHGYDPEQFNRLGFTYRINRKNGDPQHFSVLSAEYSLEQQPSLWGSLILGSGLTK